MCMIDVVLNRSFLFRSIALLVAAAMSSIASAAVLSLDSITRINTTSQTNLTNGNADWAYWAPNTAAGQPPPVPPTNRKLGGSIISNMTNVGGTTLRGSTTASTPEQYTYTDGTSPTSATNASLAGLIFNSDLGSNAPGKGISLTLTGDPTTPSIAKLYFGGFAATGNLTLTLNGATTVVDASQVFPNTSPKQMAIFTVRYQPDSASDLLTVQWTASNITDATNGHVGAQAVTVATPEPGTISLAAAGMLLLGRRRNR
jgi:PEP-CTERM motif